jgi:hypothetical protein
MKTFQEKHKQQVMSTKSAFPKIEEGIRRWKDLSFSWMSRINIVEMVILLKTIYKFHAFTIKMSIIFFTKLGRIIQEYILKQ